MKLQDPNRILWINLPGILRKVARAQRDRQPLLRTSTSRCSPLSKPTDTRIVMAASGQGSIKMRYYAKPWADNNRSFTERAKP